MIYKKGDVVEVTHPPAPGERCNHEVGFPESMKSYRYFVGVVSAGLGGTFYSLEGGKGYTFCACWMTLRKRETVESWSLIDKIQTESAIGYYKNLKDKKMERLNPAQEAFLDEDTKTLVKAGMLYDNLELTDYGSRAIWAMLLQEKKAELVKIAQKRIDEATKK